MKVIYFISILLVPFCPSAFAVSLDDAFLAAIKQSETIQQTKEKLNQAEARLAQVRGGIFPHLAFNVNHTMQPEPDDPVARQFSPAHQTTVSFSVAQPIFRGFREWQGLKQLHREQEAEQADRDQALLRLYAQVAENHLQVLSLERDLKNLREQSDVYQARVKELGARVKRGESNRTDMVTAESTHASLLAEIGVVQGQLEVARETFHFLTGLPSDSVLDDPSRQKSIKLDSVDSYLEQVEKRPDVIACRRRLESNDNGVSIARGAHLPSIDAVGNYYLKRPGFLSDLKWDIGVRLTLPLFEGGATQAKVTEAISLRKEAELELEKTRRAAVQEIRSIHRRLLSRLEQLKYLERSTELSKKNTTLLQKDFRRGLTRNIDVQLALTEFRASQRSYEQAIFASHLDMFQLRTAAAMIALPQKETRR